METWVFKTQFGTIGFFQKEDDWCYICVQDWPSPKIHKFFREGPRNGNDGVAWKEGVSKETLKHYISWTTLDSSDVIEIKKLVVAGEYFPRMNRNNIGFYQDIINSRSFLEEARSYSDVCHSLNDLFRFIEPSPSNLNAFGYKQGELLIGACTQVENLLRRFLEDNKYPSRKTYCTGDYVKCRDILKLNDYSVSLALYQDLKAFSPFKDWAEDRPTQSLTWYDAYNSFKHDRSGNLEKATFKHLIESVAAIHVLLEAQYGLGMYDKLTGYGFITVFATSSAPSWTPDELFAPLILGEEEMTSKQIAWKQSDIGYFEKMNQT